MITPEDVQGVADFLKRKLTQDQIQKVVELYPGEQEEDPSAVWYLVVEKIIYDLVENLEPK